MQSIEGSACSLWEAVHAVSEKADMQSIRGRACSQLKAVHTVYRIVHAV